MDQSEPGSVEPSATDSPLDGPSSTNDESTTDPESSETPGGSVGPEDSGRPLQLTDFRPIEYGDDWRDDNYTVAGKPYEGIGGKVTGCGVDNALVLELRLDLNFTNLSFDIGQSKNSEDSDQLLVARIEGNEKYRKSGKAPYFERDHVTVDVADVAALKIKLYLDQETCRGHSGEVVAVLMNVVVT